jgi:hypothetical protein
VKITKRQLRQIINEEINRVDENMVADAWEEYIASPTKEFIQGKMVDPVLDKVEESLADYFRENADSLAEEIVPNIPLDGDILERIAKEIVSETLKKKSDEIARCARGLMDPEIIESAKQNIS